MTRRAIWQRIAEVYDTPRAVRSVEEQEIAQSGLCYALYKVSTGNLMVSIRMRDLNPTDDYYWWPLTQTGDALRATFAGLMAAMTNRERDQLVPGL